MLFIKFVNSHFKANAGEKKNPLPFDKRGSAVLTANSRKRPKNI